MSQTDVDAEFGQDVDWKTVPFPQSYYPSRLEYFVGKALAGLITVTPPKERHKIGKLSVYLGQMVEEALDELDT